VLHRRCSNTARHRVRGRRHPIHGVLVLDVVYLLGIIAVFALVGMIAKGVERL
jgi:hypothetical protein